MNKVILIGRLTKDPEIRVTQSGKKVASVSLAVDDGKDINGNKLTLYFNCTGWDVIADRLESFVKKGHRMCFVGKLNNRSWNKPDGTKGYATDVLIREMGMLTSKQEAQALDTPEGQTAARKANYEAKNGKSKVEVPDEELPEIDLDSINVQMPF